MTSAPVMVGTTVAKNVDDLPAAVKTGLREWRARGGAVDVVLALCITGGSADWMIYPFDELEATLVRWGLSGAAFNTAVRLVRAGDFATFEVKSAGREVSIRARRLDMREVP